MTREAPVEITNNTDLLRLIEEVSRTNRPKTLCRGSEPIVVVSPVRKRRAAKLPSADDIAATMASAGGWRDLVDVERFKEDNRRQKLVSTRPAVDL
jgi:hypothetical protein